LENLLTFVLTGAVTYGVVMQLRGEPASLGQVLAKGLRTFFRVLGTAFLCGLRIILFTLLLIIPGIIQQERLYVAIPVSVMEGEGGGDAVAPSMELTRGSGWAIFASWLIAAALGAVLVKCAEFLIASRTIPANAAEWCEIGIALVTGSFGATLMA